MTLSWHNFISDVTKEYAFPQKVELEDWTLQGNGEQAPGVIFARSERIAIARKLDEIGVHRLVTGLVEESLPEDTEVVKEIAHLGLKAKIETCVGLRREDLDWALKSDVWGVQLGVPSSDFWLEEKLRQARRREAINQAIEATTYAKEHGLNVTFHLTDSARADQNFLREFVRSLSAETKVDAIGVSDSFGVASPEGFRHLVKMVRDWTKLPIAMHCHNDFGLATANALIGLSAGANIVNTAVNGLGERCGLTSLDEVAVALRMLYNIDIGIRYDGLCELSRLVETASGIRISEMKPIVGERAFAWESDRHLPTLIKARLPYEPDFVGSDFKLFLGKKTGKEGVKWQAEELGFKPTDAHCQELLVRIRDSSKRKQQPSIQEFLKMLQAIGSPSVS